MEPSERISSNDIRAILETVPVPAWSVTRDGSLEFFNQAWQQYTGLPVGQTATGNWTQVVHPDDVNRLLDYWNSMEPQGINARLRGQNGKFTSYMIRRRAVVDSLVSYKMSLEREFVSHTR